MEDQYNTQKPALKTIYKDGTQVPTHNPQEMVTGIDLINEFYKNITKPSSTEQVTKKAVANMQRKNEETQKRVQQEATHLDSSYFLG